MTTKGKSHSPYSGPLAEPLPPWPLTADPESPPFFYRTVLIQGYEQSPECVADFWRQFVIEARAQYATERHRRYELLLLHYGIKPNDAQAKEKLLESLMAAHVPAFAPAVEAEQQKRRAFKPTKINVRSTAALHYRNILKQKSRNVENTRAIKSITEKLLNAGLSRRTIDDYSEQMRSAASDYLSGKASDFQRQFIEVVLPYLESGFEEWKVSTDSVQPPKKA